MNSFTMHNNVRGFSSHEDYTVIREKNLSDCEHIPGLVFICMLEYVIYIDDYNIKI